MRFANGRRGTSPSAGFVGGPAITRTKPTKSKVTLSTRKTDTLNVSGTVFTPIIGPSNVYADPTDPCVLTSSLYIEGSVSYGRGYDRRKLTAQILGLPQYAVDRSPWPSEAVVDVTATGSFTPPSWTRSYLGFNQGYVINPLSSSFRHEQLKNLFFSGTQGVESAAVPATASLFYSKQSRLQTIVVKHTASFFDTIPRTTAGIFVPIVFAPGTGALFSYVTGVMDPRMSGTQLTWFPSQTGYCAVTSSMYSPAVITFNVPVSGRLVDIKVWLECIHLSGGSGDVEPLGYFGAALRNPNVTWGHAHPIRNDPNLIAVYQSSGTDYSALQIDDVALRMHYYPPHKFFQDTFLLWEPVFWYNVQHRLNGTPDIDGGFGLSRYPVWERDRGIRTVFSDGAQVPNPRHLLGTSVSGNYNGAPNVAAGAGPTAHGNNVPWTSDRTGLAATDPSTYVSNGSPPAGWLSGPGGTNAANEWPTTGSNYGASYIKPIYPLLDPIYQIKNVTTELPPQTGSYASQAQFQPAIWRGFRPGLRGAEISGSWDLLLIGQNNAGSGSWYFRQVRLEITYETPSWSRPVQRATSRRLPRRHGPMKLCSISGTDFEITGSSVYSRAGWDWWVSDTYTDVGYNAEVGRTFGLVMNSGSIDSSQYAVVYRLSGALASQFGPAPAWLTNNQFGMPAIPESSASLSPPSNSGTISSGILASSFFSPSKTLDGARRLEDVANDINPPQTLAQLALSFVSSSAT